MDEKERQKERRKQQEREEKKRRSLHDKHRDRRKRDCMIGLPFIIAFQGDPAQTYYCADRPTDWELIPRTDMFPKNMTPLARLKMYMWHHVTSLARKVLIYKAA